MSKTGEKETPKEPKSEEQLLKEYYELKDFYKNDDNIGMNIVSFGTLINSGLFSVVALVFSSQLQLASKFLLISIFGIVGFFANLGLFLRQSRINLYMEAWMLNGRDVENKLRDKGYDFAIFKTQKMIQKEKRFEYVEDGKTKTRSLDLWERVGSHRLSWRSWMILVFLWAAISVLTFVKWFTLR